MSSQRFLVRGADGNAYGPVDVTTAHDWIRERRLVAESEVCREGESAWLPLSSVPELASALPDRTAAVPVPTISLAASNAPRLPQDKATGSGVPAGAIHPDAARRFVRSRVTPPAVLMLIHAGLSLPASLLAIVGAIAPAIVPQIAQAQAQAQDGIPPEMLRILAAVQIPFTLLAFATAVLGLIGGICLLRLRARGWVIAGAIATLVPASFISCCGCLCTWLVVGVPGAIWTLVLLSQAEVKEQIQ